MRCTVGALRARMSKGTCECRPCGLSISGHPEHSGLRQQRLREGHGSLCHCVSAEVCRPGAGAREASPAVSAALSPQSGQASGQEVS